MAKNIIFIITLLITSHVSISQSYKLCMNGVVASIGDFENKFRNDSIKVGDSVYCTVTYDLSTQSREDKAENLFRSDQSNIIIRIRSYVFKSDEQKTLLYIKKINDSPTGDKFSVSSEFNKFPMISNVNWMDESISCNGEDNSSAAFSDEVLPLQIGNVRNFNTNINISSNVMDPMKAFFLSIQILKYDCALITSNELSEIKNDIYVYPNPSSNGKFKLFQNGGPLENVRLFNSLAKDISENYNRDTFDIDLSDRPKGVYFLQYKAVGKVYSSRIVTY